MQKLSKLYKLYAPKMATVPINNNFKNILHNSLTYEHY